VRALGLVVAALAMFVPSACAPPEEVSQQAEELASVSAEGALLAHAAAEGATLGTFTRVHARALAERAGELARVVDDERLAALVDAAESMLGRLADEPGDRTGARRVERALENVAERAKELPG
jgi:hypothetical protein